jgi:hypothetical protein
MWLRTMCFGLALLNSAAHAAAPYRDSDGWLELPDCASAGTWRASGDKPTSGDAGALLNAAWHCAKAGQSEESRVLWAMADALPASDYLFGMGLNGVRTRIALQLGEVGQASALMRHTSRAIFEQGATLEDPTEILPIAPALQDLNVRIAQELRASDPARAVEHQLLAARAHEFLDLGLPAMADLCRQVALEIAMESGHAELVTTAGAAILAVAADRLTARDAARLAAAVDRQLSLGDQAAAIKLVRRMRDHGNPDVARTGERFLGVLHRPR